MSWIVDRATSVCSESSKSLVRLGNDSATGRGATSEVTLIDWVFDSFTFVTIESERSHTHFVHVGSASHDCTSITKTLDSSRIDGGNEV